MANVFTYLKEYGNVSMEESPLNEVDCLIFSRLAYLPVEGIVSENFHSLLSIGEIDNQFDYHRRDIIYPNYVDDLILLDKVSSTKRFAPINVAGYVSTIDLKREEQFAVMIFYISPETALISFRGTDDTMVGWKENFNMAYMAPVPSQAAGVEYTEKTANALTHNFVLCGHSKGGNLAVFAAAFASPATQQRILAVCNNDGPGFNHQLVSRPGYKAVESIIKTFVPADSVVGVLLERQESFTVVASDGWARLQHNLYLWQVEENHFTYLETTSTSSRFLEITVKAWLGLMSEEELQRFVDALFEALDSMGITSASAIDEKRYQHALLFLRKIRSEDEEIQNTITMALSLLFGVVQENLAHLRNIRQTRNSL